jgi:Zn-dependent peptidase ImmA (M78 family)
MDQAYPHTTEEIFQWVASQLEIAYEGSMPEIKLVDKSELGIVFEKNNQKSYLRWQAKYGAVEAQKILSIYLREIIGLFDPKTNTIYIADWLAPCRRQSVLAHEITHFLQYKTRQIEDQSEITVANQKHRWEIEAYQIETRFVKLRCADQLDN